MQDFIDIVLNNVLNIVLASITLVVSKYVIPYIKNDFIPLLKEKRMYFTVRNLVEAAEQMAKAGIIEKSFKKDKVIELLTAKGIEVTSNVEAIIEACVKAMNDIKQAAIEEVTKE